tara:strand:- start:57 stop:383 length:327 start_codon:yes stop_codon:yes gene_type:complete
MNQIQNSIRSSIKTETGLNIDRQNDDDLAIIMRYIYITNSLNPGANIPAQVMLLNNRTKDKALGQVRTGLAERIGYLRDIVEPIRPNALPVSTTTYGNKIPYNNKIGF